jgi:hypothetical protein
MPTSLPPHAGVITDILQLHPIPKATPQSITRIYKALTKPYEAFANAFVSGDVHVFSQEIALTSSVFEQDINAGLAAQCVKAFRKQQIIALKDTYVTLGVDEIVQKNFDVAKAVGGSQDTEQLILEMVSPGSLKTVFFFFTFVFFFFFFCKLLIGRRLKTVK